MKNGTQGFTLIELLIVIAIIGILAAVLIPNVLGARKRAYDTAALNCAKQIQTAQVAAQGDYQAYATNAEGGQTLDADLLSNCTDDVQFGAEPEEITGTGDKAVAVTGTGSAATYETYVWNQKGAKIYKVTETTVAAQ